MVAFYADSGFFLNFFDTPTVALKVTYRLKVYFKLKKVLIFERIS